MFDAIRSAMRHARAWVSELRRRPSDESLASLFSGGSTTITGVVVTQESAMRLSAVYSCVRVISNGVAQLPLPVYRRLTPKGKDEARDHPLWDVLHDAPNPWMTSFVWRQTMAAWAARSGNAYSEKVFNNAGQVAELWPIPSTSVEPVIGEDGELYYDVSVPGVSARQRLPRARMFHWKLFSQDGIVGMDPISIHRETIGLALATKENAARYYGNGSRPGGVIEVAGVLGVDGRKRLKAGWEAAHGGLDRAHRVAVLEQGAKWHQIGLSPAESQLMELTQMGRREIFAIFGVPPHRVQDLGNASYATLEQQDLEFLVHCLGPYITSLEKEITLQLIAPRDRQAYFAEHKMQAILRGAFKDRVDGYNRLWNMGALSNDEIRDFENMNPLPDGKGGDFVMPLNVQAIPAGGVAANMAGAHAGCIDGLLKIVQAVAEGKVPEASALEVVLMACPSLDRAAAVRLIEPAAKLAVAPDAVPPPELSEAA